MANLTEEQKKKIQEQIDAVRNSLLSLQSDISARNSSKTPSNLNAAQLGGASGIGFETPENREEIAKQTNAVLEAGGSKSQATEPISVAQAARLVGGFGLEGIVNPGAFTGLSYGEAAAKAREEKQKRTGQVSFNTSFAFNPETLKQTQRAIDKFGFALNDVANDPFEPKEFKDDAFKNVIEVTSKELAKLFDSPDQLYQAYNTNQQFKATLDKFISKGGTLDGVSQNITGPVEQSPLQTLQQTLGNAQNVQSPSEYLASLTNPQANPQAEKIALEELAPESEIAQNEIARIAQIPEDLKTLYFGDEKTMGLLQMKQKQAEERKNLIEEQERDAKRTVREKADLQIEKNRADVEQQKAKIEENRLAAKNYMTARLAKLGALKTTGAAALSLQTLETKYQGQVNKLDTAFKFAQREIEIGLNESLDGIENKTDDLILSIEEDLTMDTEKSMKEILKARQDADKEIYRITEQYARRLRTQTSKYADELKKEAEKYAKEFAKTISNGLDKAPINGVNEGEYVDGKGVLLPNGSYAKIDLTPTLTREVQSANLSGVDTIRYFVSLPTKYRSLIIQEAQAEGKKFSSLSNLKKRYEEMKAAEEDDQNDEFEGF